MSRVGKRFRPRLLRSVERADCPVEGAQRPTVPRHSALRAGRLTFGRDVAVGMLVSFAVLALIVGARGTAGAQCVGDCDGDGFVTIDEVLIGVNIALGASVLNVCVAADQNGSAGVEINEIIAAVKVALIASPATGLCVRPGQEQNLVPCAAGTVVRAFVCEDKARCFNEPPLPAARRLLASATTDQNGAFELGECGAFETGSGSVFVFEAVVGEGIVYRTAIAGLAGTGVIRRAAAVGGGADDALQHIVIGPTSEAAVRLLAPVIGSFDLQGISEVVATVDAANVDTSFAGLDVTAAAEVATATASGDPNVQDTIQSNSLSFSSIITGQFFATPDSQTFTATPSSLVAFQQDFPIINFNPPAGTVSCSNPTGVDVNTRPFTDVVPQPDGSCNVVTAQGNGMQAGCGSPVCDQPSGGLFSFNAVFGTAMSNSGVPGTGSLTVGKPGKVAFSLYSDDGWILGFGQGPDGAQPSYVSGPMIDAPSASPFSGFQVVGANNTGHEPTPEVLVVNFPAAGTYPFELDYNESFGERLTLIVSASYARIEITHPLPIGTLREPPSVRRDVTIDWTIDGSSNAPAVVQVYLNGNLIFPEQDPRQQSSPGLTLQQVLQSGFTYEIKIWIPYTLINTSTWLSVTE